MRVVMLFIGVLLAGALVSGCDSKPAAPPAGGAARQVTVVGNGKVDGAPDTLTANATVTFTGSDVTVAMNQTNERQQAVVEALVTAGVDRKDIATSNVTLQSQYGSDGTTVTGYQASNVFTVTVRDLSTASRVLAVITSTGGNATRLNSVNLSINDDSQLLRDARARAFNDAKDRAQQFADLSGLKLGNVLSIAEVPGAVPPMPVPMPRGPMADAAVSAVPIEPGQQTVSFQVTAVWELV
ncbi:MAG: SIMPL domain-containing protein [Mycobacterium sp.]